MLVLEKLLRCLHIVSILGSWFSVEPIEENPFWLQSQYALKGVNRQDEQHRR